MHLNKEHLTFLARFAKMPEGRFFLEMLAGRLAERDRELRHSADNVHQLQGRALELEELIETITNAQRRLDQTAPSRSQATLGGLRN